MLESIPPEESISPEESFPPEESIPPEESMSKSRLPVTVKFLSSWLKSLKKYKS